MQIHALIWTEERVEHIAAHDVQPEEVEQVCFGRCLILRARATGANPVYYVLGQSDSGRYLFCVIIQFPNGLGYPVTARTMTQKEQQRFKSWRKK